MVLGKAFVYKLMLLFVINIRLTDDGRSPFNRQEDNNNE